MVAFNPYDPRAAFLLGMGGDMLQAAGWQQTPVSFGQALGAGLRGGRQSMMEAVQMKRLQDAATIEEGLQKARQAKLEREAQAAEDLEALIAGLPPEQQRLARLDPKGFVEAQLSGNNLFEGNALMAQSYNIYRDVAGKLRRGEPVSDQEWADYRIAYGEITKPEVRLVDGQEVTIRRNIPQLTREGTAPLVPVTVSPEGATPETEQIGGSTVTRKRVEPKEFTADQAAAAGFANRMTYAAGELDKLFAKGTEYPVVMSTLKRLNVPGTRYMMTAEEQQMVDLAKDFARASLRRESGAAISIQETIDEMEQYFPVPGDTPEAIRGKAALRRNQIDSFKAQSQGAFDAFFGGSGEDSGGSGGEGGGSGEDTPPPQTEEASAAGGEAVARPKTLAEVQDLPKGTRFIWDGQVMIRN